MENEYINRMIRCGINPCEAYIIYHRFKTEYAFSDNELEEFIESLEGDNNVAVL